VENQDFLTSSKVIGGKLKWETDAEAVNSA